MRKHLGYIKAPVRSHCDIALDIQLDVERALAEGQDFGNFLIRIYFEGDNFQTSVEIISEPNERFAGLIDSYQNKFAILGLLICKELE